MARISSSTALSLLNAADALRDPPRPSDLVFMVRFLAQVTLPHSDPGAVPVWRRRNGKVMLTIYPFVTEAGEVRYPYAGIPRLLLLLWIVTEVVRTRQRRLELGDSLAGFMRRVGLSPGTGGGKRSDARRLLDQMERLFRARIVFEDARSEGRYAAWAEMPITDGGQIGWGSAARSMRSPFGNFIIVGEAFFQAILSSSIPLDLRAVKMLRRSPLALDLYVWATHRAYGLKRGIHISWSQLRYQVGAEYADLSNFQKAAVQALKKVEVAYPEFRYEVAKGAIRLLPCRTAVPRREKAVLVHGEAVPVGHA